MTRAKPWHGMLVATALPLRETRSGGLAIDFDAYAEHVSWLAANGCDGVTPNGSLGEYQNLSAEERAQVVATAVAAAPEGFTVLPGVAAYGADEARHWAEQAGEAGAPAVMLLPPNSYRADDRAVMAHYREAAKAGVPVVAYNNPHDTKVDLVPELLAELFEEGLIVAVKEFSGDIRRVLEIQEVADIDVIAGADDLLFESLVAGAVGWFAGYPNAFPREAVEIFTLVQEGRIAEARELYSHLVAVFRWDSRTEFVQAIKLSIDIAGHSTGGRTRPPRGPLTPAHEAQVRKDTEKALSYLASR